MSRTLIDEPPLLVLPSLAMRVGLNQAIAVQQLHWALGRRSAVHIDGRPWLKADLKWWGAVFPFWSEATIRRTLKSLSDAGLIETSRGRESNVYAINYDALDALQPATSVDQIDASTDQSDRSLGKREVEREERTSATEAVAAEVQAPLFGAPSPAPAEAKKRDDVDEKVEKVWDHYARVFAGRFRLGLTDPRRTKLRKALKAVEYDVDICLKAINGLAKYRTDHPDGSKRVGIEVIFETSMQDNKSLTDKITGWAEYADDSPVVTGALSGTTTSPRVQKALVMASQLHRDPEAHAGKKPIFEQEVAWLAKHGLKIVFDENGRPKTEQIS